MYRQKEVCISNNNPGVFICRKNAAFQKMGEILQTLLLRLLLAPQFAVKSFVIVLSCVILDLGRGLSDSGFNSLITLRKAIVYKPFCQDRGAISNLFLIVYEEQLIKKKMIEII